MEFNEKLQELRKQKGLTQEELAEKLYVSRTAVSKWESGRGYPNIDSLKQIANVFSITIDELLSSDELLNIAENDKNEKENRYRGLVFGLLDVFSSMLFFLPFFAQKNEKAIYEVSLLSLDYVSPYLKITFILLIGLMVTLGLLNLSLQNNTNLLLKKIKYRMSLLLNIMAIFVFTICLQPYASIFLFAFLIIKILILTKNK